MIFFAKRAVKFVLLAVLDVICTVVYFAVAACLGAFRLCKRKLYGAENLAPSIVWGSAPIKNNSYWARSVRTLGFRSETFTTAFYASINNRSDWDRIVDEEYAWLPGIFRPYLAFLDGLIRYEIFVIPYTGFFIGDKRIWRLQAPLIKLAGGRIIVIPYGADAYSYRYIRSTPMIHGLMMSYPAASRYQLQVEARLKYWTERADVVIPGFMGPDGFGRWDVLIPSSVFIDLAEWQQSRRRSTADGLNASVVIAHAPNHRGFKGSEFVIDAVEKLKAEGLKVELVMLEGVKNLEVRTTLEQDVDIHVEQLIASGFGMNAIEGMASGLPVLANLDHDEYTVPFRRWSYLSECPIVSATPESIVGVLRHLVTNPTLRHQIGDASRSYAEKYHGLDSSAYLFGAVIDYLRGRRDISSLTNLYHPLIPGYSSRMPKIAHPLVQNRIVGK